MAPKQQLATSQEILPPSDYPEATSSIPRQDLKLVVPGQAAALEPSKLADPLAPLNALSEAEKIALFS